MHRWIRNPKAPSSLWDGLVLDGAYAGLHPGTNRFVDGSGLENHGTLTNMDAATDWVWSDELTRQRMSFDATEERYVNVPSTSALDSQYLTVCAWVYRAAEGTLPRIVDRIYNGQFACYLNISGIAAFAAKTSAGTFDQNVSGANAVPAGGTKHIAWRFRYGAVDVFSDGVLSGTNANAALNGPLASSTSIMRIAQRVDGTLNRKFSGSIADALIFSRPIAQAEISWLADHANLLYVPDTRRVVWVPTPFNPTLMRRRRRMAGAR